jgi:large subunit ribosomal protein L22
VTGLKTNERPGTRAVLRYSGVSAYKAREVLDLIRGQNYERATEILEYCDRGAADVIGKLLHSAAANARHNDGLEPEEMYVSACFADEGTTLKRWRPRARGRASRIRKRTSHITVILSRLPDDQLARRRARRAAEQSERRARRVAGGLRRPRAAAGAEGRGRRRAAAPEPVETAPEASEAMAALEEARALDTTSHHQELEAEAESALDHEHEDEVSDATDADTAETPEAAEPTDEAGEADDEPEATEPTDSTDEESDDEPDASGPGDVADAEAEASTPEASTNGADDTEDGEEN